VVVSCDSAAQCYYEAYVRRYVFHQAAMYDSYFLPPKAEWSRSAPCENDTTYLHKVIQVRSLSSSPPRFACVALAFRHLKLIGHTRSSCMHTRRAKYRMATPMRWAASLATLVFSPT
jgi:hypothetical protein